MAVELIESVLKGFRCPYVRNEHQVMVLHEADPIRTNIVVDGSALEQVCSFVFLVHNVSYVTSNGVVEGLHKLNHM